MSEFFRNNENIKAAGVKFEYTHEQIEELVRCSDDPLYFTEKYVQVEHVDYGIIPYQPREYQKKMFSTIDENRYSVVMIGRQSGKCYTKNTKYKVRNKKTGETLYVTAEEFHALVKGFSAAVCDLGNVLSDIQFCEDRSSLYSQVERKFIESISTNEWEIETHDGWVDITHSNLTIPYDVWILNLENGIELECADTHIIIDTDFNEVFAQDSLGKEIQTKRGASRVVSVVKTDRSENMYDLSVDSDDHLYYANEVLSHNTLVAACYILWYAIFKPEKLIAILANKADMAAEVLHKLQVMYEMLPAWIKPGVLVYNKRSMEFANGSRIVCSATSASAIRGKAVSLLYVDELAFIPRNIADPFMASIYPTVSSGTTTKIIFSSTPYGLNHFFTLWQGAVEGKNNFVPLHIHYSEVSGRDEEWAREQRKLIGDVRFEQEYGCLIGSEPITVRIDGEEWTAPIEVIYEFLSTHTEESPPMPPNNFTGYIRCD